MLLEYAKDMFAPKPYLSQIVLCLTVALGLLGVEANATEKWVHFHERPEARDLAIELENEAGIPAERTLALLQKAEYQPKVVKLITPKKPAPGKKRARDWDDYRNRFLDDYRINGGVEFWSKHEQDLIDAEATFGVPAEVIVAIIGVETVYGRHTGTFRIIDSLATLGFNYPKGQKDRSAFFKKELASFIHLCSKTHLACEEVKGSYAGAIGIGQFMPSSWQAYAVDGDKDGIIDLLSSERDAIFSVANFLKVHGWQSQLATRVPVKIKHTNHLSTLLAPDIVPTFTAKQMIQKGLELKRQTLNEEKLALIELVRADKPSVYVVGGQNFYVVTRYNRSSFYANAVLELAEVLDKAKNSKACTNTGC